MGYARAGNLFRRSNSISFALTNTYIHALCPQGVERERDNAIDQTALFVQQSGRDLNTVAWIRGL